MIDVEVKGQGYVSFPDDTPEDVMLKALRENFPAPKPAKPDLSRYPIGATAPTYLPAATQLPKFTGDKHPIAAAIGNVPIGVAEFALSPEGMVAGGVGGLGGLAAKVVAGGFAAQGVKALASDVPEALGTAFGGQGTPMEKASAVVAVPATLAQIALGAKGAQGKVDLKPVVADVAKTAPATAEALQATLDKAPEQPKVELAKPEPDMFTGMAPEPITAIPETAKALESTAEAAKAPEAPKEVAPTPEAAPVAKTPETLAEPPKPAEPAPEPNLVGVGVQQVPADQIALKPELMQFKRMDDTAKGTTAADKITGEWSDLKAGNVLLWEPKDPAAYGLKPGQKYIVANGHHRVAFGEEQGVQGYNAQIIREADGYRAEDARRLGAEINIADGKGTIYDQAKFIRNTATTLGKNEAVAEAGRIGTKGKRAADIAINASDSLFDSFINEKITPEQTEAIANAVPGNEGRQQVGIRMAVGGMAPDMLTNFLKAMDVGGAVQAEQMDMFGADESAIRQAEAMAKRATDAQKAIRKQITAVQGAARNPAEAAKLGVNVTDPQGVLTRIRELKEDLARWENWPMHSDLVAQARGEPAVPRPAAPRQQEIIGMGGAVPSEFEPSGQTQTGIKNASIDRQRAERGLDPIMKPLRESFQGWWDKAMAMIDDDPAIQDRLIAELQEKTRPLEPVETALLLHREADLRNEYAKATRDIAQAFDDGREQDVVEARARRAMWSDKLTELEKVTERAGTEQGRGLVARKMMVKDDFTLAGIETDMRAAAGGRRLTAKEMAEAEKMANDYKAKSESLEKLIAQRDERISKLESEKAFAELQAQAKPKYSDYVIQTAEKWVKQWDERAELARQRLAGKFLSPTPEDLLELAYLARSHIGHLGLETLKITDALVSAFGEGVRPYVAGAIESAKKMIEKEGEAKIPKKVREQAQEKITKEEPIAKREAILDKIAAKVEKKQIGDIGMLAQKLARMFVEEGTKDRETLIDQVHELLRGVVPDWTRRDTMDSISGYGQFKQLTKDQVSVTLRDLKGQMQQVGKLQDMAAKQAPLKTGVERRTPSDEERALIKQVNEMKRKGGFTVTDPATQLRSALQSRKTYYEHRLTDLKAEIATRQRTVKTKTPSPTDPALGKLIAEYKDVKSEHDKIFGKSEMTDEQRVKLAMGAVERSIADLEQRIKSGDIGPRTRVSKTPSTPELEAARAQRDALKEQLQEMRDLANPKKTPEEIALQAYKTRVARQIADLTQRTADGDFTTKPRKTLTMDTEALALQADLKRIQKQRAETVYRMEQANRAEWQKLLDRFVRWERAFKLSSPVVFGKLTAAALTRGVTTTAEEVVGAILGKAPALREVAAQAPREGGINVPAMAKALTAAFTKGMKDAKDTAKTGLSELDILYGEKGMIDKDWVNIFGQLHGALKAPVKRAEFELSLQKRIEDAIRRGIDIKNELVQTRLHVEALNDAYASIFMQRNFSADMFNNLVGMMEGSKKYQPVGEISARVARFLLPIVRVPTNIIGETVKGITGVPVGIAQVARAWGKGLENLPPEQADAIMRNFKKGSIGLGLMAIGYFNPQAVGGYDWREKREAGAVKAGGFQLFGVNLPRWMTHAPWFELMQFGATIRHVKDQHVKKTGEEKGVTEGMWAAALGLAEETPFVGQMIRVDKMFESSQARTDYLGELAKSTVSPAIVQRIAEYFDPAEARKPKTFMEHVMAGIPGLRQNVPEKTTTQMP